PLHMGVLPLENYCEGLIAADYPGILSLELDFPRFLSVCSAGEALISSLDCLQRIMGGKAQ
ncbi:MAG: hypothetical protein MJ175_13295, partial [Clostridia bacterium]|nr:hypothetical protein [Clostridia bacterium]